jgi:hypothetical protein
VVYHFGLITSPDRFPLFCNGVSYR